MPNNEIRTGKQTNGEFTVTYQQNGYGGCIPVIDGNPEPSLMFGYVSESDKEACMRLLEEALRATGGNLWEVRTYIANAVRTSANDIKADEAIMVQDREFLISYTEKKAYLGTEEVANLDDITCDMPGEAVKALLVSRIETELARREEARVNLYIERNYDEEDDDYEDDCDEFEEE